LADICIAPGAERLRRLHLAQPACEVRDDMGIQYLLAIDLVREAQRELNQAVTVTNMECALTKLRRVEEYRRDLLRELKEHCERHGCSTPETEEICQGAPVQRAS
jgi:hypothetical protein